MTRGIWGRSPLWEGEWVEENLCEARGEAVWLELEVG